MCVHISAWWCALMPMRVCLHTCMCVPVLCCAVRICCSGQTSPHGGVKRMPSGVTPAQKRYDVCGQLSLCERLPGPAHALTRASAQTFPAAKRSCAPTTGTDAEQRSAGGLAACAQKPFVADGRAVGHDFPATTRRTCVDLQPADIAPTSGTTVPLT